MAQFNANTTTAEYGNQNKAVADLQASLNAKGANLKVDSKYGPLTQAAVAKYGSTTPPSDTITSDKLKNVTPIPLPDQKPQSYGGLQGAMEGVVQQNQKQSETPQQDAYLQALKESGYISSTIDRTEQDKAKRQSDLYTSQIEQEQLANRRQIENLQKNMQGALASGISIEADRLTRQSLSKQADLAILQTAANRNYDTAASIADRQLEMKLEQSRANLEALKMLDQREYGEITAKKEREYKKQEEVEQQIKQLKLNVAQYGGGVGLLNQLSAIDTTKPGAFDQAVKIAGKYASDPLDRAIKQAQLNKLNAADTTGTSTTNPKVIKDMDSDPDFAKLKGSSELKSKLTDYQALLKETGAERKGTKDSARLDAAYQEVLQAYRAAKNLGALQGADLQLVDNAIKQATFEKTVKGRIINIPLLGIPVAIEKAVVKGRANSSIDEALRIANKSIDEKSTLIKQKNPDWANTDYFNATVGTQSNNLTEEDYANNLNNAASESAFSSFEDTNPE